MQGLVNLGNTCYINTLVQCIGHVDGLREWVLARGNEGAGFTKEFQHILSLMWDEEKSLMPKRFVESMQQIFELDRGEQHDLCEVILRVLDRISFEDTSEVVSIEDRANVRGGASGAMDILYKMAVKSWKQYHPRGFRTFDAVVEGLQVHQVQCTECKRCFHNFEPFMVLNIDLHGNGNLQDGIRNAFGTEVLNEWSCDHCKKVQRAEKTVRVWQFPKVLVIALKRFAMVEGQGRFQKVRTPITLLREVEFDQESTIRGVGGVEAKFVLRSVGLHHGSMNHGHYTCVANHKNKWIHYDDINVSEVQDIDTFCRENTLAYVLMYERA